MAPTAPRRPWRTSLDSRAHATALQNSPRLLAPPQLLSLPTKQEHKAQTQSASGHDRCEASLLIGGMLQRPNPRHLIVARSILGAAQVARRIAAPPSAWRRGLAPDSAADARICLSRTFSECLLMACQRAHLDIDDRLGVPGRTLTSSRMLQGRRLGVSLLATRPCYSAFTRSHGAVVGTPVDTARHGEIRGPGPD